MLDTRRFTRLWRISRRPSRFPCGQISVVGLKDPLYRVLRRLARTARKAIADIRLTSHIVDSILVEDVHIYRSS